MEQWPPPTHWFLPGNRFYEWAGLGGLYARLFNLKHCVRCTLFVALKWLILHQFSTTIGMTEKALGQYYFRDPDCPVNLSRVARRQFLTHEHDLTEVEHFHDFVEIVFILNGQGVQQLEGNAYNVSTGDVFVLQGYQRHYFKDASSVDIVNVMFDTSRHPNLISERVKQMEGYKALFILEPQLRSSRRYGNMLHLTREELAPFEWIINCMFAEQKNRREGHEILLVNHLEELIILLARHVASITNTKAKALLRLSKLINFLENNFADEIYTENLAAQAFMSKRNFIRIFQEAVGMSPNKYLRQIRLQKARSLLGESSMQIDEIASVCGFGDSNFFIKCFKQAYAITPNKYRARFKV
jgi:AraC-like DNA-binding protein/mannose-6-phosphate isomerase-like protein (cupin superfamily)